MPSVLEKLPIIEYCVLSFQNVSFFLFGYEMIKDHCFEKEVI